jgi:hypothetical protein
VSFVCFVVYKLNVLPHLRVFPMPIRVTCPGCQTTYTCPDAYRGKRLKCKHCPQEFFAGPPAAGEGKAPPALLALVAAAGLVVVGSLGFAAYQFFKAPPSSAVARNRPVPGTGRFSDEDRGLHGPPTPAPPLPVKNDLDLTFAAADFNAAVVLHPRRCLRSPLLEPLVKDLPLAQLAQTTGIDPRQMERVVLFLEPFPGGNVAFFGGVVVRFAEDVDGKALLTTALRGVREVTFQGKTYLKSTDPDVMLAKVAIAGYVADARTLVVAPEPTLHKMLAAQDVKGPLTQRLRAADLRADAAGVFVLGPFRGLLAESLRSAKDAIPEPLAGVNALPEQLVAASGVVDLASDNLLTLHLEVRDAAAADALHQLIENGLALGKTFYPQMRQEMAKDLPPELTESALGVADELVAGVALSKEANTVSVRVKTPQRLAGLATKLGPLLKQMLDVSKE